jgi:uroporphyrinogen-III decarboxylase
MFRLTLGACTDLIEREDEVLAACEMLADRQIEDFQYFRFADLAVKRVCFPLHKGMDGFMSDDQYENIYWKPFRRMLDALIEMDVTPFIYTEGPYNTRLDFLSENVPEKKCIVHFETVDMARAKETVGGISCISGNLPVQDLMYADEDTVVRKTRELLDTCMPGGGYIFDTNAAIDYAKPENMKAMFDTVREFGVYE